MKKLLIIVLISFAIDGIAQTSYQERIAYSKDTGLINKVRVASYNAAQAVIADTSETSRIIMPFANEVYSNPFGGWIDAMIMGVLTNPVITPASSDNDIQFTVNNGIFESVGKAWVGYITPVQENDQSKIDVETDGLTFYGSSAGTPPIERARIMTDGILKFKD